MRQTVVGEPVTVLAAPDSFKGALSSSSAGEAVRRGFLKRCPDARVLVFPVGDGGEGTADALNAAFHSDLHSVTVSDTHGAPVAASFGICTRNGTKTAVLDMASAAGLRLAQKHDCELPRSSTRGVGEMIRTALNMGCRHILVGLGGSGTCDGGVGALAALGVRFTGENGQDLTDPRTEDLGSIRDADFSEARRLFDGVRLTLLYDSGVPLTGPHGAVLLYARQKGAREEDLPGMERDMIRFADLCDRDAGKPLSQFPGAGAAGGLGYGLSLIGGELVPGAQTVLDAVGFPEASRSAGLVITGEGKTDAQTATGKLPLAVCRAAKEVNPSVKTVCLCGVSDPTESLYRDGVDAVFALADRPMTSEESMERTEELLEKAAFNLAGLI